MPDHSTFSKNRHGRFRDSDLLRHVFETVVRRCMAEGLVGGEGFAVDASLIKADANRQRGVEGTQGLAPEMSSRAIDEYLAVLDDAAFGAATEVTPKFISPADPAARWTRRTWRTGVLRLFRQLSDRSGPRDHRRCRGLDCDPPGRSDGGQDHDRARRGALRPLPGAAGRRHGLWIGRDARSGWSTNAASSPTSRCSTSPSAPMARSPATTSPTTTRATSTSAPAARC